MKANARLLLKVLVFEDDSCKIHFYRPQRSCDKVMFSQVSVILFTGVACVAGEHV